MAIELGGASRIRDLAPHCEGSLPGGPSVICGDGFWIWNVKEVCDLIVDCEKPLRLSGRFELLHDPLPPSCWLMRILGPIIQSLVLSMLDLEAHLGSCSSV